MILLPNQCSMGQPTVYPKNWKTGGIELLKLKWKIHYYFRDEKLRNLYPKGKYISMQGMNAYHTLEERRAVTRALVKDAVELHRDQGYNPITRLFYISAHTARDYVIHPNTPIIEALKKALSLTDYEKGTKTDIKNSLTYIFKSIEGLGYQSMKIHEVKRRHIRAILDNCMNVKDKWTPNMFNKYRKYLSMLYTDQLVELEAVDCNPIHDIKVKKTVKKKRLILTPEERVKVNAHLYHNFYSFWRYAQIFFHSGRRTTELLKVRKEHVNITNQTYVVVEKKGKQFVEKVCPIKNIAVNLWLEVLNEARPNQYLFSEGLVPGDRTIRNDQISKRWRKNVKLPLGVQADFYSLKHSNANDIASLKNIEAARDFIGHQSEKTTRIYAVDQDQRDLDVLKKFDNEFC